MPTLDRRPPHLGTQPAQGQYYDFGGAVPNAYNAAIVREAAKYGIDPRIVAGVMQQETGWMGDPERARTAKSPIDDPAVGLMQLMRGTASDMGVADRTNPEQNIAGGTRYLAEQLDKFGGDLTKALAAYNAGPGNVDKYGGVPPFSETQGYVANIPQHMAGMYKGAIPAPPKAKETALAQLGGSSESPVVAGADYQAVSGAAAQAAQAAGIDPNLGVKIAQMAGLSSAESAAGAVRAFAAAANGHDAQQLFAKATESLNEAMRIAGPNATLEQALKSPEFLGPRIAEWRAANPMKSAFASDEAVMKGAIEQVDTQLASLGQYGIDRNEKLEPLVARAQYAANPERYQQGRAGGSIIEQMARVAASAPSPQKTPPFAGAAGSPRSVEAFDPFQRYSQVPRDVGLSRLRPSADFRSAQDIGTRNRLPAPPPVTGAGSASGAAGMGTGASLGGVIPAPGSAATFGNSPLSRYLSSQSGSGGVGLSGAASGAGSIVRGSGAGSGGSGLGGAARAGAVVPAPGSAATFGNSPLSRYLNARQSTGSASGSAGIGAQAASPTISIRPEGGNPDLAPAGNARGYYAPTARINAPQMVDVPMPGTAYRNSAAPPPAQTVANTRSYFDLIKSGLTPQQAIAAMQAPATPQAIRPPAVAPQVGMPPPVRPTPQALMQQLALPPIPVSPPAGMASGINSIADAQAHTVAGLGSPYAGSAYARSTPAPLVVSSVHKGTGQRGTGVGTERINGGFVVNSSAGKSSKSPASSGAASNPKSRAAGGTGFGASNEKRNR